MRWVERIYDEMSEFDLGMYVGVESTLIERKASLNSFKPWPQVLWFRQEDNGYANCRFFRWYDEEEPSR
ncbi:unnamed protein product [Microthlaspi erraticum]|uniref:Uncharacterized protein n=1 Tax=Microthlaspi erraticum TaxID=1685480 RepID=A0A6D2HP36_9BRAS|nr:unnamed protein product [Microthlaspi erraticum]